MSSEDLQHLKSLLKEISKSDLNLSNKHIEETIDSSLIEVYSTDFLNDKNDFLSVKQEILILTKKQNDYQKKIQNICCFTFFGTPFLLIFLLFFLSTIAGFDPHSNSNDAAIATGITMSFIMSIPAIIMYFIIKQGKNFKKLKSLYSSIFGVEYKKEIREKTLTIIKQLDLIDDIELNQSKKYLTNYLLKNLKEFNIQDKNKDENNFFIKIQNQINDKIFTPKKDINDKKITLIEKKSLLDLDLSVYHQELLKQKNGL